MTKPMVLVIPCLVASYAAKASLTRDPADFGYIREESWLGKKPTYGCNKLDLHLGCVIGICCYDNETIGLNLGCFENGPLTKWCHQVDLPDSPATIDPQFYFYTPDSGAEQRLDYRNLRRSVAALRMDSTRPLFIVVHGFGSKWPKPWLAPMRDALRSLGNNVLIVRWTKGSATPDYFKATANTRLMGVMVARVIEAFLDSGKGSLDETNLVEFSLGAHVVGFAGATLSEEGRAGLRRIIGVDPAGPLFASGDPVPTQASTRLNPSNARLVQCMHGNGEPLSKGGEGTMQAFGHVDFYANGGEDQPGCPQPSSKSRHGELFHMSGSCSHNRNAWLFTTSVLMAESHATGCKFQGIRCPSPADWEAGRCFDKCPSGGCPSAGYETDLGTSASGAYYYASLATNASSAEFCGRWWRLSLSLMSGAAGAIAIQAADGRLTAAAYPFQRGTESLAVGDERARIVVWDWALKNPTNLLIDYSPADDSAPQGLQIETLVLEEHGTGCSYRVSKPPGTAQAKKPLNIVLGQKHC